MSDAYQFRTLDRTADTRVIDRDDLTPADADTTRPIEGFDVPAPFTPATPRWIPPKTERTARQERESTLREQAYEFGGFRWGSAFFGWVSATGIAVLLAAAFGAIAFAISGGDAGRLPSLARTNPTLVGLTGAIVLGVTLLVAYYCGGYVAGRMARFAGLKQGFAVWLWALAFAVVGAAAAYFGGARRDPVEFARSIPGAPSDPSALLIAGAIALAALAVVTVAGALLGGRLGMRYHRRVDFAALDD
jgi:hypothetical protein